MKRAVEIVEVGAVEMEVEVMMRVVLAGVAQIKVKEVSKEEETQATTMLVAIERMIH